MSPSAVYLTLGALADLVGVAALLWWFSSRKRIAAQTIGRAEEHSRQLRQQAERDAESIKKEAQIEAREKTHALMTDAETKARARQQEIIGLEHGLAEKTRSLADRISETDRLERDLRARDGALAELQ